MDSKKLFGVGIGVLAVLVIAIVIAQPDLFLYLRITAGGDGDGGTQLSHTLTWTAAETDLGTHTIDIVAQDDQGGEATRTVTITVESGALQFSDFNFEVGDTTATMSWVTDKPTPGTGKADILDLDDLRLSEVDPSIGTSHSVTFTSLVPCTVYTANAEALLNDTLFTSDNQTFTTTGCTGGASIKATAKAELSSNGKEVKIDNAAKINFAQGQGNKSAVHLVQLDRDEALANIPSVDDKSAITGLYETTVVTGPQQKKGSLDGTATVTLEYTPAEDTDEETLSLYRYANGTWTELADRSIDTDAQTISGTTTEFSAVAGWASGGGSGDPEPSPSPSPSPPSDGGGDSGGGDSGGGGGGDSGGGGGGGGGDDSGGGEAAQPVRTYTIQAETGHQIKGAHAGVVKEGSTTAVKLAGNTDVLARKVTVPRDNYFLEVRVKDDAPGPVNYAVYVNDRAWKVSRADKGDNKYRTYRLGRLSNFASGTIRFRLINDTYDKANPGFEPTDRNLFVDYWRLTTAPGVSQGSTPTSTGGGAIATGGRSGGWTVLPRLNQIMREELGSQFIIPSNHSYYAARLTLPSNNRAVIQTEEHLRAVLRYWRGLRPNFPRGDDFDL